MEKILGGILWLSILLSPFLSKYAYWKYAHRAMTYKHLLVDVLFFIFAWGYIPFLFILLDYFSSPAPIETAIVNPFFQYLRYFFDQSFFILIFLFPILVSFFYGYIYKRYFQQVNPYFAFQIFICYLIIPLFIVGIVDLVLYLLGFLS